MPSSKSRGNSHLSHGGLCWRSAVAKLSAVSCGDLPCLLISRGSVALASADIAPIRKASHHLLTIGCSNSCHRTAFGASEGQRPRLKPESAKRFGVGRANVGAFSRPMLAQVRPKSLRADTGSQRTLRRTRRMEGHARVDSECSGRSR